MVWRVAMKGSFASNAAGVFTPSFL